MMASIDHGVQVEWLVLSLTQSAFLFCNDRPFLFDGTPQPHFTGSPRCGEFTLVLLQLLASSFKVAALTQLDDWNGDGLCVV